MKIIATSTGQDLDAALDPRFGRCAYFVRLDTDSGAIEAVSNPFLDAAGGAGTQAAQWVLDQEADVLLTGQCGPKATAVLRDSGLRIVEGASGSVREASALVTSTAPAVALTPSRMGAGPGAGRCRRAGGGGGGCGGGRGAGRGTGAGKGLGRRGRT
ncbi:Dinitrogenase iron-molybdenum cofactor biosynthesis protein [Thiorhodococcus drewsii AZ1]|uniref:Dinitrogenase iron-molybdenum cofactor biosynthesis protein n=1 Tax=Thiorhodococcus drewsii AZ1 TaxID=765913 RepID=G2E0Q0_9GAMM|nr:NifB/NifX family molybdenum-iron cluster-binding protein [Thiorhodococcus drewsii]EGV31672.1 Dinitrogenase iron-molybdenum cofactor biosynthesis protein [Thiorhodococcus drewsii AZ1]